MSGFRHAQQRLQHRGRSFLFMSYEAEPGNPKKSRPALPDTWYLLSSNNRWPAIPHVLAQPQAELIAALTSWLEATVFAVAAPPAFVPTQ